MEFYRIYHIDAKGEISGLRNFTADSDVLACEQAVAIMAESKWSGIELWEGMRQVHCVGITRGTVDAPNVPPQELVPPLRPHQSLL